MPRLFPMRLADAANVDPELAALRKILAKLGEELKERRAGVIDQLLNEANKQGEKSNVEGTPVKEAAPAK